MGVFKCDTDALTIKVQSDLKNGKTSLDDGANILAFFTFRKFSFST